MIRIRSLGILLAMTIAVGAWVTDVKIPDPATALSNKIPKAVLGMELAQKQSDLTTLLAPEDSRTLFAESMARDFWFIAFYTAAFIAIALVLPAPRFAGWVRFPALATAVVAGYLDTQENNRILDVLAVPNTALTDAMAQAIRDASWWKWVLIFVTVLLLTRQFAGRHIVTKANAVLLAIGGVLGLVAIFKDESLITVALPVVLLSLAIGAAGMILKPAWFAVASGTNPNETPELSPQAAVAGAANADLGLNTRCKPHQIPFRTILQEHECRRRSDLVDAARTEFKMNAHDPDETVLAKLKDNLKKSEDAYSDLDTAKRDNKDEDTLAALELACSGTDISLKNILHAMAGNALCFSGGGIRSACFNLGILEGLARFGTGRMVKSVKTGGKAVLGEMDYLSTVSGGGYIGSWLMAWTTRLGNDRAAYARVLDALAGSSPVTTGDPEPRQIRHLREFSDFLSPRLGLTLDTWALAAIVLRNLIVNWLLFLPLIFAAIAGPQIVHWTILCGMELLGAYPWTQPLFVVTTGLLLLIVGVTVNEHLPSKANRSSAVSPKQANRAVLTGVALPAVAASLLATCVFLSYLNRSGGYPAAVDHVGILMVIGAVAFGLPLVCYRYDKAAAGGARKKLTPAVQVGIAMAAFAVVLTASAIASEEIARFASSALTNSHQTLIVLLGVPAVITGLMVASATLSGFLGQIEDEEEREWWTRTGGMLMASILVWIGAEALTTFGGEWWKHGVQMVVTLAGGATAGAVAVKGGFSGQTSRGSRPVKSSQLGKIGKFLSKHDLLLPALSAVALGVIALAMAAIEILVRDEFVLKDKPHTPLFMLLGSLQVFAVCFAAAILLNGIVNINIFSLHGMYRLRLMRAFLGASNTTRKPDPFINFDEQDSPKEKDLPCSAGVPLHIINTTLNLVGTSNLAWQERKAESFTFSPVACGAWRIGYVPTAEYAGDEGPSLATAMAISGAAFNPNMGYYSSPLVTLLMTLCNARLGWWLPNPGAKKDFLGKNGPTYALGPLLREAFGDTNSDYEWVELTDGGHFENLGLYEMVLRRCHRIIVADAGADPQYHFEDLGNALRKIQIDLGIPIRFDGPIRMSPGTVATNLYCAIGTIDYQALGEPANGELVYIKTGLCGAEPPDIRQYAATHKTFPHESTANQFFNESQFESYRHLGAFVIEKIASDGQTRLSSPAGTDLDSFFTLAKKYV